MATLLALTEALDLELVAEPMPPKRLEGRFASGQ